MTKSTGYERSVENATVNAVTACEIRRILVCVAYNVLKNKVDEKTASNLINFTLKKIMSRQSEMRNIGHLSDETFEVIEVVLSVKGGNGSGSLRPYGMSWNRWDHTIDTHLNNAKCKICGVMVPYHFHKKNECDINVVGRIINE